MRGNVKKPFMKAVELNHGFVGICIWHENIPITRRIKVNHVSPFLLAPPQ